MKNRSFILFLLAFVNFTHIMDFMIVMPLGDVFMTTFDVDPTQFGIIVSSYTFAAFISGVIAAFFIDRFDRKKALVLIYAGFALGNLMCALSYSYPTLVAARALTGFSGGVIGALLLSIISDMYSIEKRGKAMGIMTAAFSAAAVLGIPLGLYLAKEFTWNSPFFLLTALSLVTNGFLLYAMPSMSGHMDYEEEELAALSPQGGPSLTAQASRPKRPSPLLAFTNLIRDKNTARALLLSVVLILGQFIVIPFIAPFMTRNVGFSENQIIWLYGIGGVATIISAPIIGRLTDKFGIKKTFMAMMIFAIIPTLVLTHLGVVPDWQGYIVTSFFFISLSGRVIPAQTLMTGAVHPSSRGSFMSLKAALQQLSQSIASIGGGIILVEAADGTFENFGLIGWISAIGSILAVLVAMKIKIVTDK